MTDSKLALVDDSVVHKDHRDLYRCMVLIRVFEDCVFELYAAGHIKGTTHLCQGQEAVYAGTGSAREVGDMMTCTYRGHGECIAWGMDPAAAMAEILGRRSGVCGGKGGSMHLTDTRKGILGSFAVVGAGIPVAAGAAWAAQLRGTGQVAFTYFGDGATNIGAFHETLNIASVWRLPAVFICINNQYAEYSSLASTTPVTDLAVRAQAYAMDAEIVDGNDVLAVREASRRAADHARRGDGPVLLEMKTYRQAGHSRGDLGKYRPKGELEAWLKRDPIATFRASLVRNGDLDEAELDKVDDECKRLLAEVRQQCLDSEFPDVEELTAHVNADQ